MTKTNLRYFTRISSITARTPAAFALNRRSCIAALAALAAAFATEGRASSITSDEVAETLMTAQESSSIFMGSVFGPSSSSALKFSAALNPAAATFSYATAPGQTYDGLAFSMDTVGSFDAGLDQFEWTTTASLGTQTWTGSGTGEWVGDPTLNVNSTYVYKGVTYTVTGTIPVDGAGHSEGTLTYTDPTAGKSYTWASTDFFASNGLTVVHANGFNEDYSLNGNLPPAGGVGNFAVGITPTAVPEPASLSLFAGGAILIAAGSLRKRNRRFHGTAFPPEELAHNGLAGPRLGPLTSSLSLRAAASRRCAPKKLAQS